MTYKLFIDDERFPITDDWKIARSSQIAFQMLRSLGIPQEIAFDHDLGVDDTSMYYCHALGDYMLDNNLKFPVGFKYSVHSQNPVGRNNIESYMDALITEIGV